jgi:Ca-activated chloride channel family protein
VIHRFADPTFLTLLLVVPLLVYGYVTRRIGRSGTIRFSDVPALRQADGAKTGRPRHALFGLRVAALVALLLAFARPQSGVTKETVTTAGIDIVLTLDLSRSMLAEDLQPNRLEAARHAASAFVAGRRSDRIGLVVFAGEAYTQAPLTIDYGVLTTLISQLDVGTIEDGTAIGMGLATAVKRLRDSEAKSKVVVLLTDGKNNRGEIDPLTAAQMAQALGIKVYAIGTGTHGTARVPIDDPVMGRRLVTMRVDIDETTLQEIARLTGGRYFRATDRASLERIYQEIDQLETTEVEVEHYTRYGERFPLLLTIGLVLLVAEIVLGGTWLRRLP